MATRAMTFDELLLAVRDQALDVRAAQMRLNELRTPDSVPAESAAIKAQLEQDLSQMLSVHLDMKSSQIDVDASFADLGMDSLVGAQWVRQINERYRIAVSAARIHEHASIAKFAEYILARLQVQELRGGREAEVEAPIEEVAPALVEQEAVPVKVAAVLQPSPRPHAPVPIAIVALSGRYPKADSLRAFWNNMAEARDCITEVPPHRWSLEGFYETDPTAAEALGRSYCKWGGFLDDVDTVDRQFFSPWLKDIQHRGVDELLLLQTVWALFESGAYTRDTLLNRVQGDVGVYLGARPDSARGVFPAALASGIASFFGLQGPCLSIDTMSASSMTAIHTACVALERGECQMAIAAGLNILERESYVRMSRYRLLGSHAGARSFTQADGMLPAEGIGAVLLKPLENALRDGDPVLAVIKSTMTANSAGQPADSLPKAQLIARNLSRAGVDPRSVSYVETAASGNAVVDASELDALRDVFEEFDVAPNTCAIGSAKSYIGHALSVSGLSQLTRVVMQLSHGRLLPGFHPTTVVDFLERTPFFAPAEAIEWKRPVMTTNGTPAEQRRRALINSYGGGGAMVSVLLEEAPDEVNGTPSGDAQPQRELIVLSARSLRQLLTSIEQLLLFLDEQPQVSLQELAFTLQVGRESMEHRWAAVVESVDDLKAALLATLLEPTKPGSGVMLASISSGARTLGVEQLKACAAERLLKKIAAHWAHGGSFDWLTLWRTPPRRINAPSYPFASRE